MLTHVGDIGKVQGAIDKLTDATEKLCGCVLSETVGMEDHMKIQSQIDSIGMIKQILSMLLPKE